ncbi:zinc finger protein 211-like isoform X2 [Dermacentor albipictus]|uniref:zinc finger protein 211-like isoform X2 n=1 Tax=Dermacentor albipictus TaxID=60249 RepID=UPI0031FDC570
MAEERVNEHTPPVFSFTNEETLSANRENTRGASSSLGTYPTISDDAWRYHWNTQPRRITDRTYSVDGTWAMVSHLYHDHARVSEYGSTNYVHQPFSTSIDYATPSTSLTDMEQASAIVEGGARMSQTTHVDQWNTQYLMADVRSTDCGHIHVAESGITSSLPMVSSSSINHAQPSTSRACMEEASAIPENLASISDDAWLYQCNTQQRPITDWTYNVDGHTEIGSTGFTLPFCSSSPVASTSYACLQEPSDIFGNYAWNATGTGGREQQEFCGACSSVSSRQDALHAHTMERTGDTAYTCKASDPVNDSVNHCRNTTGTNHKCVTCGKMFHRASLLATHYRTHTNERPYKCEICEKSFRQSHHRDIHKRTHTGERPYTCKTCGKSFAKSWNLRTHNYTHTDEKPHVCPKCSKPFKTKKKLKHHNFCCEDRALVCEICNASFKNNSALDRHRRSYMHG